MRFLALVTALCVVIAITSDAQAGSQLKVSEIHGFVADFNRALNSSNRLEAQRFLENSISANAVFEQNTQTRHLNYAYGHWVHNGVYPYAYRYPYTYYPYAATNSNFRALNKLDLIATIENKKRVIGGYQGSMEIMGIKMPPMSSSAVVDIDFKEHALTYAPHAYYGYAPVHAGTTAMAYSKCKLYLSKHMERVWLTRMDCNTNANGVL